MDCPSLKALVHSSHLAAVFNNHDLPRCSGKHFPTTLTLKWLNCLPNISHHLLPFKLPLCCFWYPTVSYVVPGWCVCSLWCGGCEWGGLCIWWCNIWGRLFWTDVNLWNNKVLDLCVNCPNASPLSLNSLLRLTCRRGWVLARCHDVLSSTQCLFAGML